MDTKTHISHVRLSNILGITDLEFSAGKFVQISGPNGSGKTSILEAIKATLRAGHDATLLRAGAEKGEAVIVLDDGTEITKRVGENSSDTIVKDASGRRVAKPGTVVAAMADLLSVNPVDFLRAGKKERVAVLLESMPIELDMDRVRQIIGGEIDKSFLAVPALDLLAALRRQTFDNRTGTNRAVKEKHATINQLAATLPDTAAAVPGGADGLLGQLAALDEKKDAELKRIETKLATLRSEKDAQIEVLQKLRDESIAELRRQIEDIQASSTRNIDAERQKFSAIEHAATTQRERTIAKHTADSQGIRDNLTAIQESQKAAAKHEATRGTIKTMQEQAHGLEAESEALTAALDDLEAYKSELLAALPIPGLTVVDGEIYRDGVQFDRLNQAQQVQIAVEIAKLRSGTLGVVCCDGLECLDSSTMDEFTKQSLSCGLQMFVSRVSDEEFSIKSV